jgi:hypothetical protein
MAPVAVAVALAQQAKTVQAEPLTALAVLVYQAT